MYLYSFSIFLDGRFRCDTIRLRGKRRKGIQTFRTGTLLILEIYKEQTFVATALNVRLGMTLILWS